MLCRHALYEICRSCNLASFDDYYDESKHILCSEHVGLSVKKNIIGAYSHMGYHNSTKTSFNREILRPDHSEAKTDQGIFRTSTSSMASISAEPIHFSRPRAINSANFRRHAILLWISVESSLQSTSKSSNESVIETVTTTIDDSIEPKLKLSWSICTDNSWDSPNLVKRCGKKSGMAEAGSPKLSPGISSQQELAQRSSANSSVAVSTSSGQSAPPQLETSSSSQLQSSPQRLLQTQQQLTPQQQHSITNHLAMQQQNRNAAAAALRNLAPRQQVPIGTEIMRMMNSIPPLTPATRSATTACTRCIATDGTSSSNTANGCRKSYRYECDAGQGPQQLIPIGMRMVPNGTQSHESLTQGEILSFLFISVAAPIQLMSTPMQQLMPSGTRMQHNSMVRLVQHQSHATGQYLFHSAWSEWFYDVIHFYASYAFFKFYFVFIGKAIDIYKYFKYSASGVMPQNLVPVGVGIAQSISGLQQMHVQQQQQQLMLQQQVNIFYFWFF
uniref:LIM zinc-binding domain-containing protein n=1 Tax=Heterorhabditis bacteriophora TaxID=37862 RepID=A0A1I7XEK5_HETBA